MVDPQLAARCVNQFQHRTRFPKEPDQIQVLVEQFQKAATDEGHAQRICEWLHENARGSIDEGHFFQAADATRERVESPEALKCPRCQGTGWVERTALIKEPLGGLGASERRTATYVERCDHSAALEGVR